MSDHSPIVPLTLEGASLLHQMMRVHWSAFHSATREHRVAGLAEWLSAHPNSALYGILGHKGDVMLVHYRRDFAALLEAQREVQRLPIADHLSLTTSYLSVVELGLYESTRKIWDELGAKGLTPDSPEWDTAMAENLDRQRKAMAPRLWPEIPQSKYLCFYPMDRLRGEAKNWYTVPFEERQRLMQEHGLVGRKYGGLVKQVISGSIGFDDFEWGVDLYADDPLWFKRLIYEMRFDEVSAVYAKFGPFYIGVRLQPDDLAGYFA